LKQVAFLDFQIVQRAAPLPITIRLIICFSKLIIQLTKKSLIPLGIDLKFKAHWKRIVSISPPSPLLNFKALKSELTTISTYMSLSKAKSNKLFNLIAKDC
jgi:hypothetical protein